MYTYLSDIYQTGAPVHVLLSSVWIISSMVMEPLGLVDIYLPLEKSIWLSQGSSWMTLWMLYLREISCSTCQWLIERRKWRDESLLWLFLANFQLWLLMVEVSVARKHIWPHRSLLEITAIASPRLTSLIGSSFIGWPIPGLSYKNLFLQSLSQSAYKT